VKSSRFFIVLAVVGLLQVLPSSSAPAKTSGAGRSEVRPLPEAQPTAADQNDASLGVEHEATIPGPLRSFLRMAGISLEVPGPEVLSTLSHNLVLLGYQRGKATEYLILLRRYVLQAKELTTLAGTDGSIHITGCKDSDQLLRILGYRVQGECARTGMSLVTADPERAFVSVDSGFPLVDLEEALQRDSAFTYPYAGVKVPALFGPLDWNGLTTDKKTEGKDVLSQLLYDPAVARLYWGLSRIEPETRMVLKKDLGLAKLLYLAPILDLYGNQICVRNGEVAVPGGKKAEKEWEDLVGASTKKPGDFIYQLITKDRGWFAAYYDAMARASESQQEHFAENQRLKRYYAAFRTPGLGAEPAARLAFRPAPALMVLVTRMQWDADGNPYVPGSMQAWADLLKQNGTDAKYVHIWTKHFGGWKNPEQLAEAMFVFSREETDGGPLQTYLGLSELDLRRGPQHRLSNATVMLMAKKYADYSDQYLVFSEFPELSEAAITHLITTADSLSKISDHTVRGNAMGTFQASVGLWQILARQGQIDRAQLDGSWDEMLKPFAEVATAGQLVTAGRASVEQVFRSATGKTKTSQDEMIDLLAGARQSSAEGQKMHAEVADRLRLVMADQRLVTVDTLFGLDDVLKGQGAANKEDVAELAGELREFEMPQPIFTNSERTNWAAGTYNNRHTELEMKTDIVKVLNGSASAKQKEEARGKLATFLRDTLVGMNYAYYEPPGSQVLHNNPLFVRSHDFSGDTVMGVERLWQAPHLFGEGSPAGGGAHLIGSLADLPYVLAEAEQDFIAPDHVQALIWQQFVPGLLSNAVVPRWWDVSRSELHAVTLYQKGGEELLTAAAKDEQLRSQVVAVLSERMFPERRSWMERNLQAGKVSETIEGVAPADTFYLTVEFRAKYPGELGKYSASGRELEDLMRDKPDEVGWERLARDFGVIHPVFAQTYAREFISVRPFPALGGNYSRLMSECWDSGNLYWARLADEMGYDPVVLNRIVPALTLRMVERIYASDLEDWPATLRALHGAGEEFRQGKGAAIAGNAGAQ
jgi:hypothetical protein